MELLEPKPYTSRHSGEFILSKFNCVDGREIMLNYPILNLPKIGDYLQGEKLMYKLMSFVEKVTPERNIRLENPMLVKQHVKYWSDLILIEWEMLKYNFDFLETGELSTFLQMLSAQVDKKATQILTGLSATLSQKSSQAIES